MGLPFISSRSKRRDSVTAVDLGGRTTKAVNVQRQGDRFKLNSFTLLDAPVSEGPVSTELLTDHLKTIASSLSERCKGMSLAISVNDSIVRQTELPVMPPDDMRLILKTNAKTYLQQDYPNHIYDCHIMQAAQAPAPKTKTGGLQKQPVLVAGAKAQLIHDLQQAVHGAGFIPDHVVPNVIGPINAFEFAYPQEFAAEVVALIDLGFHSTSISLLQEGGLVMNRVIGAGSDRLTNDLAEAMSISYAEAEGIKIGMPGEIQSQLELLLAPLGRELRASMDFYEHQYDRSVTKVFVSGGAARSELMLQILQAELMMECQPWNPVAFMELSVPPEQAAYLDQLAPQLAVAIGTAMATL